MLRRKEQGQHQRQQQQKHLCEGVWIVENGKAPPRHTGVDLQIHIGGIYLHTLNSLDDAVSACCAHADSRPGAQPLQVLPIPHGTDGDDHQQRRRHMVDQKTGGQPRRIGEGHGQRHGSQHQRRIEADPGHIQTAARPHSPGVKQQQQQNAGHKAICVVPALVGDAPQRRDAPGLGNGGTVSHVKGQSCEKAVLKGQVPRLVPGVKQRPRQVHQSAEHPAQEAVLPRPGRNPFPAQRPQDAALLDLSTAPAAGCRQKTVEGAVLIDIAKPDPYLIGQAGLPKCHSCSLHMIFQAVQRRQCTKPAAADEIRHDLLIAAQALGA